MTTTLLLSPPQIFRPSAISSNLTIRLILHSLWNFSEGDADPDFEEHTLLINALNRIFAGFINTHWSPPPQIFRPSAIPEFYLTTIRLIFHSLWNFSEGDADPDFEEHTLLINALNRIFAGFITTHWSPPSGPWPENIILHVVNCSPHDCTNSKFRNSTIFFQSERVFVFWLVKKSWKLAIRNSWNHNMVKCSINCALNFKTLYVTSCIIQTISLLSNNLY